ncbi:MAG: B12-binding domain-containing radical SAM protein [Spirochaetes bacterium]|nr:B12-binding domain-containing radical SAM protein [Spirochaetota bacterium]
MRTKVLMIYPEIPTTYWSFKHALKFVGKKTQFPPLGLITVAAMMPERYDITLVDMNVRKLRARDVDRADLVFVSAMIVQKESFRQVVEFCKKRGKTVVAGGPYPTSSHESIEGVDHFILGEAETVLPDFLRDYEAGAAGPVYNASEKPDITATPVPRFDLLDIGKYFSMMLQFSRGCPFNCEFCDIIEMFGRKPRTKTADQFLRELQAVYDTGFRGSLFVVDDNFIGNKAEVRKLLPRIIEWQKERGYPYTLFTEASVNLGDDPALMDEMVEAGFDMVFLGIETPVEATLHQTQKAQNTRKKLIDSVRAIQNRGIEVSAGFIIGFDTDPANIFDLQIQFIQESGITMSMIGLMMALPNTQLYRRLAREGRLLAESSGNNTHDLDMNFVPVMDAGTIAEGYRKVLRAIYDPKNYFARCLVTLDQVPWSARPAQPLRYQDMRAFVTSLVTQALSPYGHRYLAFLWKALRKDPAGFPVAVRMAIREHHFHKITRAVVGSRGRSVVRAIAAAKRSIAVAPAPESAFAARKG